MPASKKTQSAQEKNRETKIENTPMKRLLRTDRGNVLTECATLFAILVTAAVLVSIIVRNNAGGIYQNSAAEMQRVQSRIVPNCLNRTRANDLVSARQARPYNCFRLHDGDDRITVSSGENAIYPGYGRDRVVAEEGTGDTEIIYEGGQDIYHFRGGTAMLDLERLDRDRTRFRVALTTPDTMRTPALFDPKDRKGKDLMIDTPRGSITIASHFSGQPVSALFFKNTTMSAGDIRTAAIKDQATDGDDRIIGTQDFDQISPGTGNDIVFAGGGNDVIIHKAGDDIYDAGTGRDVLSLEDHDPEDVVFSIAPNRKDILADIENTRITLSDQARHMPDAPGARFAYISFAGSSMGAGLVLNRAVQDQVDDGRDVIMGSQFSDTIRTSTETRVIDPGTGNDTIIHTAGNLEILNTGPTAGKKTLVLTNADADSTRIEKTPEDAMIVTTPGGRIQIHGQYAVPPEEPGVPIDRFRIADRTMTDATFRAEMRKRISDLPGR